MGNTYTTNIIYLSLR